MQLGHKSERGLHVLRKIWFVVRKQEGLTFVNIVFMANNTVFFDTGIHRINGTLDYIHSNV